jgi:hypothetical protein
MNASNVIAIENNAVEHWHRASVLGKVTRFGRTYDLIRSPVEKEVTSIPHALCELSPAG